MPVKINFRSVLRLLKMFIREVERTSFGYCLRVDFSKGCTCEIKKEHFLAEGAIGIIESADIKTVYMVSLFLHAFIWYMLRGV